MISSLFVYSEGKIHIYMFKYIFIINETEKKFITIVRSENIPRISEKLYSLEKLGVKHFSENFVDSFKRIDSRIPI